MNTGKRFGQRRPPLSASIRRILDTYPDGQIFKEMIQNADDAGAGTIQFYVDCRQHGNRGLVKPELNPYQGPALISANDALFSDQDWEGIQSLQQSIKVDDPFKVGRFGIGFNSVYHLTDVPMIISGSTFAFLEPREQIWSGETGRLFTLSELSGTDHLIPLHGIADFNAGARHYPNTLFRFPLRNAVSGLSDNCYTVQKVNELINAIRSEANLLLIFLRSIHTIEVYNIDQRGRHSLSFRTNIADSELQRKRTHFLQELKSLHSLCQYGVIKFTAQFDMSVEDTQGKSTSHWLVANRIDTTNATVRAASAKQKVFPWVGTAVKLDNPGHGRIFCFLPMPIEISSNLPVHVNGTFGLNDDRRSIKWPGVERRNDLSAQWNQMLVRDVIPSCYVDLLQDAKLCFQSDTFYNTWPDVTCLEGTQWEGVLNPVLSALCRQSMILSSQSDWVTPSAAVFLPRSEGLVEVVKTVLIACGVKLAEVPAIVQRAFTFAEVSVTEVNPTFLRDKIRPCPASYTSRSSSEKLGLLKYCLSDRRYLNDQLINLELLPLVNGSFTVFQRRRHITYLVYITTADFHRRLLPNLDFKLVNNADLQTQLIRVAQSNTTQLKVLDESSVSTLLDEATPSKWKNERAVLPEPPFNSEWFSFFWTWVKNKQLSLFQNKLIFPVHIADVPTSKEFAVARLSPSQPLLYFPYYSKCDSTLLSLLDKFGIQYCTQTSFPYVEHKQLTNIIKTFSPDALLEVIALKGNYASVNLSFEEARYLRSTLVSLPNVGRSVIMLDLRIFLSCANTSSKLHSINEVSSRQSLLQRVVLQPSQTIDLSVLPSNLVILSSQDYHQNQLLNDRLRYKVPRNVEFLTQYILPNILTMGDLYIDPIMTRVLDMYQSLRYTDRSITTSIQNLAFVNVGNGVRKCPSQLFDPHNVSLSSIYKGESVFPSTPYHSAKYIGILRYCGLRTSVSQQEVLDVIYSISSPESSFPQEVNETKMHRSKAILQHLVNVSVGPYGMTYKLQACGYKLGFQDALEWLSYHRSWLPVLADTPDDYPSCLPWKGKKYTSHFISLKAGSTCVHSPSLSLVYGSEAYFTHPCAHVKVHTPECLLVSHFENVIACREKLTPDQMIRIVCEIYSSMQNVGTNSDVLNKLMKEWVYIKKYHKFVDIYSVALKQSSSFCHNIEPYLYILPDSISAYAKLFKHFGMSVSITRPQIVSMLGLIKKEVSVNSYSVSPESTWSTVLAILNWLTENGTKDIGSDSVYVPVESDSILPDLREPSKLVYADNDYLKNFISDSDTARALVHSRINQSLAKCLCITPLSEELDISEDTFEDAGQHEPLTVRLKNILRDYKDGPTIVKELIQNADDAEATEVNICYDTRNHTTERDKLFFPDMCKSHGPALVIQNDKTFSNEDFVNIQKLAGATKQSKHLKIGKFGVGFCSVYHITDVPSFVSRNRLYIFDPTLRHLEKAVKNPSRPGKRVNYLDKIITPSKQMEPYEGLFGFNKNTEYEGTMFRLPFRKSESDLSDTCYSESAVRDLIEGIKKCGDKLLLFLQHVKRITIQRFDTGKSRPEILYELSKPTIPLVLSLDNTSVVAVESEDRNGDVTCNNWLVATQVAENQGKPAVANVACMLKGSGPYSVNDSLSGEIFCYLPLSQTSGLPVHVSCNFTVINNRRGIRISECDEDSYLTISSEEVQWNVYLMRKVIPVAYLRLLWSLMTMHQRNILQEEYIFHSLWPLSSRLQQRNPWEELVNSLYKLILKDKLFYSLSTAKWLTFQQSRFLDMNIFGQSESLPCVLEILHQLDLPLVDLPPTYRDHFPLSSELIQEKDFIELFFNNLPALTEVESSRNEVVYHLLKTCASEQDTKPVFCQAIMQYLKGHSCIPTTPDGSVLRKCTEVIDPRASFSRLFDEGDHRFPFGKLTDDLAITALKKVGMIYESLPWDLVIDRAQSVGSLIQTDKLKALERVRLILQTISICSVFNQPPSDGIFIDTIPFLPVMKKPENYPLSWYGDKIELLPGNQIFLRTSSTHCDNLDIAASQVAFLCEENPENGGCDRLFSTSTKRLLNLRSEPSLKEVVAHVREVIAQFNSLSPDWISKVCSEIYRFIDKLCQKNQQNLDLDELKTIPCIWNGERFLEVDSIALCWKMNGPYLYSSPPEISSMKTLSTALGIKESFQFEDATKALQMMKSDFGLGPVSDSCQKLISEMISIFNGTSPEEVKNSSELYLPDTEGILHSSSNLVYNDVSWAPLDKNCILVHSIFSRDLAVKLGIRLERSKLLEQYVSKKEKHFQGFGQHEELTRRIQNIIRDYPFDMTILKELLQNADDAKAQKMYIILDKRTHGKESIISKEWQELQGPALLVWNDSTFTEKDLKGIQELGLGSKRSDTESIGQFGIGFNVVYHLTDCPSFVTGGDTLCVFDPHCRYVPEAESKLPGGRYDNLRNGFWKEFKDMASAYLQTGLDKLPEEFQGGSLFRFPIRHSHEMVRTSKIVSQSDEDNPVAPLTAQSLSELMKKWIPFMKQAMFFLNNIKEIKYFEISDDNILHIKNFYKTATVDSPAFHKNSQMLKQHISEFTKQSGSKACTILYPITLTEIDCTGSSEIKKDKKEKWLIQLGIGDINNEDWSWQYVKTVKPKHAIAASLEMPADSTESGQLFCFLPLPAQSGVPVHINGSFVLNSTRRGLWVPSDPKVIDDKSRWNNYLFKAISSSYARFLVQAREHFFKANYKNWPEALNAVRQYYKLFPTFTSVDVSKKWDTLSCDVYKSLILSNAKVLCVLVSRNKKQSPIAVEWHSLVSQHKAEQVHFWSGPTNRKIIRPILQSIGLKITPASPEIMDCFNNIFMHFSKLEKDAKNSEIEADVSEKQKKIPGISPSSVFKYYTECSKFSSSHDMKSCHITQTVFRNADTFLIFVKYLVRMNLEPPEENKSEASSSSASLPKAGLSSSYTSSTSSASQSSKSSAAVSSSSMTPANFSVSTERTFSKPPFTHFLLLTADNNLTQFESKNKVLNSKFFDLYSGHLDKFLHPKLRVVPFDSTYFVQPKASDDSDYTLKLLLGIFEGTFPSAMKSTEVSKATDIIDKKKLTLYWECFKEDKVFSEHLLKFLKSWALLLTTDNRLFSTSTSVLPAYLPAPVHVVGSTYFTYMEGRLPLESGIKKVCDIMKSLKMPFLDETVVVASISVCPQLSDHYHILTNFYHTNQLNPLTFLDKEGIKDLIHYFSSDLKPSDEDWLMMIRSLPLFEDVAGNYQTIFSSCTFLWPNCCEDGYSEWIYDTNIFIKPSGNWTSLGSASQFSIEAISAEELYTAYIFKRFDKMNEKDRYKHLLYIRQFMYTSAKSYSTLKKKMWTDDTRKKIEESKYFLDNLKTVKCIGSGKCALKPISAFCDHNVEIFKFFSCDFQHLPKQLQSEEWLDFFKELRLKVSLETDEYLELCNKVAARSVSNVAHSSDVLLEYLFSCDNWHYNKYFLQQVSNIAFVPMANLATINWIMPQKIICKNQLVRLNGAASARYKRLLWTVKPIIYLPQQFLPSPFFVLSSTITDMLLEMNVCSKANLNDVVTNIKNISQQSPLSDSSLFTNYPAKLQPPEKSEPLLNIMAENFRFLNQHACDDDDTLLKSLQDFPCIPVHCDLCEEEKNMMILVKPSCVLSKAEVVGEYHPYLHSMPAELKSYLSVMQTIGVKHELELCHMQIVLQKIFSDSKGKKLVDPNVVNCVKKVLSSLKTLLQREDSVKTDFLSPLYLPDINNELKLSTTLIYGDTPSDCGQMKIDLSRTKYSLFDITKECHGVDAASLCLLLPEKIRPLKVSVVCTQVLSEDCSETDHSDTSRTVKKTVEHESNPSAITKLFNRFLPNEVDEDKMEEMLTNFFSSLTIRPMKGLSFQLSLRDSGNVVGHLKSEYHIDKSDSLSILYIDHTFDDKDDVIDEIMNHLSAAIAKNFSVNLLLEVNHKLVKGIEKYLRGETLEKKESVLQRYKINGVVVDRLRPVEEFSFKLGQEIPRSYHEWLDLDPHNIFRPMEYVGYEDTEGHIIVAQIVHLVQRAGSGESQLHRIYYIHFSKEVNSEGKEVSVFDLYKFLIDRKDTSTETTDEDLAVVPFSGEGETRVPVSESDISKIKENLRDELKEIWKLDPEMQSRAVKRLYLRWHPDKNLNSPEKAQEIFMYLKEQIEAHERNERQEPHNTDSDDDDFDSPDGDGSSTARGASIFPFSRWNEHVFVRSHYRAAPRQWGAGGGGSPFNQVNKDSERPEEGRRWVRQAEVDYKVLCEIHSTANASNGYGHVCFMAHQVAEKALKGGVYALCGMDGSGLMDHNLTRHAYALETVCSAKIAQHAIQLEGYYLNTRYPNRWSGYTDIPSDHYNAMDADVAKQHALAVLDKVKSVMPQTPEI